MRTSLVITTHNWPEALDLVLRSVQAQSLLPNEVIVADDGSAEQTARTVRNWATRICAPVRHVRQEHDGFRLARLRNLAIAAAEGEHVVIVDGDMVLHQHFVADHVALAQPGCFVQGSRAEAGPRRTARMLANSDTSFGPLTAGIRKRHMTIRSPWLSALASPTALTIDRVKGCNVGFWRQDLVAVNGYDERFVGWGPEDKECAARLMHIGVARKYARFMALAIHLHHPRRAPSGHNPNDALLAETLAQRSQRCALGLDQHREAFACGIPPQYRAPWPIVE